MRFAIWTLLLVIAGLSAYMIYDFVWPEGKATVVVLSDPPGARVWIDLEPTAFFTNGELKVSEGEHSFSLKQDGYVTDPFVKILTVNHSKRDTVFFQLIKTKDFPFTKPSTQKNSLPPAEVPMESTPAPERIPTASELRDSLRQADTTFQRRMNTQVASPSERASALVPELPDTGIGRIEVNSSQPGAKIFVNDSAVTEVTPANLSLPVGNHTIRVTLDGYKSEPLEQSVRIHRRGSSQFVFFTLTQSQGSGHEFSVETTPVAGQIFVDSVLVGEGKATVENNYGTFIITFGKVDGWLEPDPIRLTITPGSSKRDVKATYTRAFRVMMMGNGEGMATTEGNIKAASGIYFETGPERTKGYGPKIKLIPGTQKYGWELDLGDPNRNPPGGGFVEFTFTLPPDVPPDSPLNLRLYIYRSTRRYTFVLSNRSELMVTVNNRVFLDGFRPKFETDAANQDRFEEWSLQNSLVAGENRVMIRITDANQVFNYLWKIEIQ